MKNLLCLFFAIIFTTSHYSQTYRNPNGNKIKVEISQPRKTSADHISDMQKNLANNFSKMAANNSANSTTNNAANAVAMKDNYSKIGTDILINNDDKYQAIVLDNVSGWASKVNIETISSIFKHSKKMHFYENRKDLPKNLEGSDKILYLSWIREALNYTRITNIVVRNYQNKVVYDVVHRNKSTTEMLMPFTSSYTFNKEMVLRKLKELRELKELEIITKDEYDSYVQKYKSIILKGF